MKRWTIFTGIVVILFLVMLHILALMRLFPLYLTSPLLFAALYLLISLMSHKKSFKGFIK
ncbi:hypothetical protein Q7A53_07420 [Halobacillus rhizosphaerae]|uniref:hypothetical protein n=1 Tax=Halobacillus rhizosphaerae TaxID=3064889 RepID=UPI00398B940C